MAKIQSIIGELKEFADKTETPVVPAEQSEISDRVTLHGAILRKVTRVDSDVSEFTFDNVLVEDLRALIKLYDARPISRRRQLRYDNTMVAFWIYTNGAYYKSYTPRDTPIDITIELRKGQINPMIFDVTLSDTPCTKKEEKELVDGPFIEQKRSFGDEAPKKWVDLYTLLYYHFVRWCRRHDATLHQKTFCYSDKMRCPAGIDFYIMKKRSPDRKDKVKFSVIYDESTEQIAMRFFAEDIDIVVDGHNIRESIYCEPIILVSISDKPKDRVKLIDITNGDQDNKMEHDWRPLDVLQAYFGHEFWTKLMEIFSKFIPKQTEIFEENILKSWSSDPEYQFFDYIWYQFSKLAREWFLTGSVKQIIKSINAVDWEVIVMDSNLLAETNSFRKYRIELRHLIDVKDSNGISDDNLSFYKIDPICGIKRIDDGLDHEFGNGFRAQIELIYNSVRMKIKEFVEEEKKMSALTEKTIAVIEKIVAEASEMKFPHFSTSKDGVKLVTLPIETLRTMTNTHYGMAVNVVKDRSTEIRNAYWNADDGTATIIWGDGSKTVARTMKGTTPDPEIGFAICIAKKVLGGTQHKWRKWLKSVVDASAASTKKKSDKSRIKLEKQARARWFEQQILDPTPDQIETMIETIKAENAAASEQKKPAQKKPGRKKSTK